jgi:hypothetical protein
VECKLDCARLGLEKAKRRSRTSIRRPPHTVFVARTVSLFQTIHGQTWQLAGTRLSHHSPGNTLASCPPHLKRFFSSFWRYSCCYDTALTARCRSYRLSRVTVWYRIPLLLSPGELFHGISIARLILESSQLNWLAALYCAPIQLGDFWIRDLKPLPKGTLDGTTNQTCIRGSLIDRLQRMYLRTLTVVSTPTEN